MLNSCIGQIGKLSMGAETNGLQNVIVEANSADVDKIAANIDLKGCIYASQVSPVLDVYGGGIS